MVKPLHTPQHKSPLPWGEGTTLKDALERDKALYEKWKQDKERYQKEQQK